LNIEPKITKDWMLITSYIGFPFVIIYIYSMLIYPFLNGDWDYVQSVWHRWQSLNVGVLAFASSLIAFNISRYNSERQRERELIAAKAFLPEALSDLANYLKACATLLNESWGILKNTDHGAPKDLEAIMPSLNDSVKNVFADCIRHGSSSVADHLACILMNLQVNDSRLTSLSDDNLRYTVRHNIKTYMICLAKIQFLVNATFDFARGDTNFKSPVLSIEKMHTAFSNLEIQTEYIDQLNEEIRVMVDKINSK